MSSLDWTTIVIYLLAMVLFSAWVGRRNSSGEDYYLGGRNLPWWAIGISTMATQTSAISFISIPAFVAVKPGGGLAWLQYELAVPLAMVAVMVLLIPHFRRLELVSVYAYLEQRFGLPTRLFLSAVFLLSRGFGTGVGVYASALVLSVCLDLDVALTIVVIGVITIIYDMLGGMAAVVYSDVIQMVVLVAGLVVCIVVAVDLGGGMTQVLTAFPTERAVGLHWGSGFNDDVAAPFWAYLIGGFFLYVSYYGVDQSQAQRELSAPTLDDTKRSLMFNGLARFPLTLCYLALGVAMSGAWAALPALQASVPADQLDQLVPRFVLMALPSGLRGLLFAAILAAAMSSLDSALNSLSAATMQDFVDRDGKLGAQKTLFWSRATTVAWGMVVIAFAFGAGSISDTVVEAINKVGSAFYGPILGVFLMGLVSRRATGLGVMAGCIAGVGVNLTLWRLAPGIHWMWWNVIGFAVTTLLATVLRRSVIQGIDHLVLQPSMLWSAERSWMKWYGLLFAYFCGILLLTATIGGLFA